MGNPWLQCLPRPQPQLRKRHGFRGLGHPGKFLEAEPPGPGAPIKRLPCTEASELLSLVNSDDIKGRERSPSKLDLESQKGEARRQEKEQSPGEQLRPGDGIGCWQDSLVPPVWAVASIFLVP